MSTKDHHGLTARQKRFCDLYLSGMAAGRAYEAAGYKQRGDNADAAASRLTGNDRVSTYLKAERKAFSDLHRWERFQLLDFYQAVLETPVGRVDESSDLAQEVMTDEVGEAIIRKKVKMVPKMEAAREMAKIMGWYSPEKVEVDASDTLKAMLRTIRARHDA
jgi:phage terminase small subunit